MKDSEKEGRFGKIKELGEKARYERKSFVVFGSVHIDVIGMPNRGSAGMDKPGKVRFDIGGTGGNLAVNLASMGNFVRMVTALPGDSPFSHVIEHYLEDMGIEVVNWGIEGLEEAAFSAILDEDGEAIAAVSCMPIEKVAPIDDDLRKVLSGMDACALEANLSSEAIAAIGRAAKEAGLPTFGCAVSEDKSERLLSWDGYSAAFANEDESWRLMLAAGCADFSELPSVLGGAFVSTAGAAGATAHFDGSAVKVPAIGSGKDGNYIGAGDALAAATMHGLVSGMSMEDSVRGGMRHAARVCEREHGNLSEGGFVHKSIEAYRRMALSDALTGLPNRASAAREFESLRRRGSRFSVGMLDIDKFKSVNDSYGHPVGDLVLQRVGKIAEKSLRQGDFCARLGGEEFLFIFHRADEAEAWEAAERIRKAIEGTDFPECGGRVTASMGVAEHAVGAASEDTVDRADKALYAAKESGRNRVAAWSETI